MRVFVQSFRYRAVVAAAAAILVATTQMALHVTMGAAAGPPQPSTLEVEHVTTTSASLSWVGSSSAGVAGFRVFRGPAGASPSSLRLITTTDVVKTYTATTLFSSTAYEFGVASIDLHNNQSAITTVTLTTNKSTNTTAPAAPSSTSVIAVPFSSSRIDVQWAHSTSSNVAAYEVWRDGSRLAAVTLPNSLSYSDTGLAAGATHTYKVRAISATHVASALTSGRNATTPRTGTIKIVRGPFLERVGANSAEVAWWTNIPSQTVLRYGTTMYDTTITQTRDVYQHLVKITGLSSGKQYGYEAGNGSTSVAVDGTFMTAARPGTTFSFDAIGDFGGGSPGEIWNASRMAGDSAQFVQTVGDNIYATAGFPDPNFATTLSDYDVHFYQPFDPAIMNKSFNPANGNKEYYSDGEFWRNFDMPGHWYSYDWGDAHIIVLDTQQPFTAGSPQYTWLSSDLSQHQTESWRIVAMQVPPYSSTSVNSSSETEQASLVPLFQSKHVNLVLSGNSHNYERSHPLIDGQAHTGGITYIVTGAGGGGFTPFTIKQPAWSAYREDTVYEFVTVKVSPDHLSMSAISGHSGVVLDSVVISH